MAAVMLRDLRTRFFDHGLGFLVVVAWPLCHMLVLLLIFATMGRAAPFGDSLNIFFATGLIPTLLFMYVSRYMSVSLMLNKPLMAFPVVRVMDIMIARAVLEVLGAVMTLAAMLAILWLLGDDPIPYNMPDAVMAYMATLLLAVGVGSLMGVMVMFFEIFGLIYAMLLMAIYAASGTLFVASNLPDYIAGPLSWNPLLVCVEWMRVAYFQTYSDKLLNRSYVVEFGLTCLFLGLVLERLFRRKMRE